MPGETWTRSSDEWQTLIVRLLQLSFPLGDFQEIPDTDRGDCGLEGFSRNGVGYQCYSAEEPLSTRDLTKKQKQKIADDLPKLIKNSVKLSSLLAPTVLSRWVLVVPRWESKDVLEHAAKYAAVVRSRNLSFISADFSAQVTTAVDTFALQRQMLLGAGLETLRIETAEITTSERTDWVVAHDTLVNNLDRKVKRIRAQDGPKLRDQFLNHYLNGQNALEKLRAEHPDFFERIHRCKNDKERFLETESMLGNAKPADELKRALREYRDSLQAALPALAKANLDALSYEAIADWLLRCPLDFPDNL